MPLLLRHAATVRSMRRAWSAPLPGNGRGLASTTAVPAGPAMPARPSLATHPRKHARRRPVALPRLAIGHSSCYSTVAGPASPTGPQKTSIVGPLPLPRSPGHHGTVGPVGRRLSPSSSQYALAAFHSTPPALLGPMAPEDPDQRNPSKAALVAQLLKDSKTLEESNRDAKDALNDSAIGAGPVPAATAASATAASAGTAANGTATASTSASGDADAFAATSAAGAVAAATASTAAAKVKPPLWTRIKHEIQHYYHGTRLFVAETRISLRLLLKMARGAKLTRREHRQLVRTSADMFKLFPLAIFVIVPFMEFALPLALKIWPDMLPSTFESKFAEEEKRKKLLKVRLDMAKFLQDTISEMAPSSSQAKQSSSAPAPVETLDAEDKQIAEFGAFFKKYRDKGQLAPTEEIVRVARKFDDEMVLNHLSRPQLASMCKFVGVSAFGTDDFLRYNIKKKMRDIRKDDKMIAAEGIESLDLVELAAACSARGIRTVGVSPARMRQELQQWIDLHLNHGIPSTLLLLSRAFAISDAVPVVKHVPAAEALQATLQSLPEGMKEETKLVISEAVGAKVDPREKLSLLKEQERMIAAELKQEEDEKKRILLATAGQVVGEAVKAVKTSPGTPEAVDKAEVAIKVADTARAATPEMAATTVAKAQAKTEPTEQPIVPTPITVAKETPAPMARVDTSSLKQLGEALEVLVSPSAFAPEMDDLKEIKKDRMEYREDLSLVESLVSAGAGKTLSETKAGTMLGKRLDDLLKRIDAELSEYDRAIGDKLNLLKPNEIGLIPMEQVVEALKSIKVGPETVTSTRIEQLIDSLDPDGDGMVFLSDVIEMSQKLQELEEEPLERAQRAAMAVKTQLAEVQAQQTAPVKDTKVESRPVPPAGQIPVEIGTANSAPASSSTIIFPPTASSNGIPQDKHL